MKEVSTTMIPSDFAGDKDNSSDCPGYRAFKRACKQLPWYTRMFMSYKWIDIKNSDYSSQTWCSYRTGTKHLIDMMESEVGNLVTFIRKG